MSFDHRRLLARRAGALQVSIWTELLPLLRQPGLISLAGGGPAPECYPVERLAWASAQVWQEATGHPGALGYGESNGYPPLRATIAALMGARGMPTDPDEVVVTSGSQQGLDLVARALLDPGDVVIVEAPTYGAALQAFAAYEPRYRAVPLDEEGMRPDALEGALRAGGAKLIYTIPNFQNPSGVTLSPERRRAIAALAEAHGVAIVEDDPYGELRYEGEPLPALRSLAPGLTAYLGSFSKILAPGLRTGWVAAPPWLTGLLAAGKETVDIGNDRLTQRLIQHAVGGAFLDGHLPRIRAVYAARRARLLDALGAHFPPSARWGAPEGGFFVWVVLPEGVDTEAIMRRAIAEGVGFVPGRAFYPDGGGHNALRLSYSAVRSDDIEAAVARLGETLRAMGV